MFPPSAGQVKRMLQAEKRRAGSARETGINEGKTMKVLIIGGGASGMMAALSAAEDTENTVTLLERQGRVGKKLLATGNGRCNLTNRKIQLTSYHGAQPEFARHALESFYVGRTLAFFESLGLLSVTEDSGKVYPLSDQASSVLDVLRFALTARGVNVITGCDVTEIKHKARGYEALSATGEKYFGDRLIIACGGAAGKKLGGSKSGYHLLSMLGHSCTPLLPSLTQIRTDPTYVKALKGVRADAHVMLCKDGQAVQESFGEVQFTEFGLSGPEAFSLSRAASFGGAGQTLVLDFFREYSQSVLFDMLQEKRQLLPELGAEDLFAGMLQSRLGRMIVKRTGIPLSATLRELSDEALLSCVKLTKAFTLEVLGVMGFESAQVTAGGVPTAEFDQWTLESRLAPGVFACGEVLDIDGDCGGFNLQWAWSSGYLAGKLGKGD